MEYVFFFFFFLPPALFLFFFFFSFFPFLQPAPSSDKSYPASVDDPPRDPAGQWQSHPAVASCVGSLMCGSPGPPPAPRARQRCPGDPFPRGRRRTLTRGSSSQHKLRILRSILRVLPAPSVSCEATKSRCSARPHLPKTRPGAPCTSFPLPPGPSWGSRQLQLFLPHLPAPQGQA